MWRGLTSVRLQLSVTSHSRKNFKDDLFNRMFTLVCHILIKIRNVLIAFHYKFSRCSSSSVKLVCLVSMVIKSCTLSSALIISLEPFCSQGLSFHMSRRRCVHSQTLHVDHFKDFV